MLYNRKAEDLRTYTNDFYRGLKVGDLKEANKAYFQLWKIDSGSADTYFKGGLLMLKELRFKEAVVEFDRALGVEPLMPDAFAYRALARLKQHKFASIMPATRNFKEPPLALSDLTSLPPEEQARVCKDLQQARALNFEERALYDLFPYPILEHCPGRK